MMATAAKCGGCGGKGFESSSGTSFSSLFGSSYEKLNCPRQTPCLPITFDSSSTFRSSDYFSSGGSFGSSNDPCANVCGSTNSDSDIECSEEEEEIVVPSEIEATQQPYKEIEAVINDNRMILRLQTEKPQQKYDPPCDCIENPSPPKKQGFSSDACLKQSPSQTSSRKHDVIFQKAEGCRTINVFPNPDPVIAPQPVDEDLTAKRKSTEKKPKVVLPTVNPEDNPNIFVLRIKRQSKKGDKVQNNLNLEFKTPRPWRKQKKPALEQVKEVDSETEKDKSEDRKEDDKKGEEDEKRKKSDPDPKKNYDDPESKSKDVDSESKSKSATEVKLSGGLRRTMKSVCPTCATKRLKCNQLFTTSNRLNNS